MNNKDMIIFGDGLQTRAFSYIDDVAPLVSMSPFVPGAQNEVFNIGADQPYSVMHLAERLPVRSL
jgi:UDP-glucose 4-epimerase